MPKENWVVYLLICCDNSLYCGCTNNLDKRVRKHNDGKASKYTRARRPVKLLGKSQSMTKSQAHKLEAKIKKLRERTKKIAALNWDPNE